MYRVTAGMGYTNYAVQCVHNTFPVTGFLPLSITRDIHCHLCEYNLRGIARDARCPECGAPVQATYDIRAHKIAPAILQARKGLEFAAFAHLLVLSPIAPILLDYFAGTSATAFLGMFIVLLFAAATLLTLLGTQFVADGARRSDRDAGTLVLTVATRLLVPLAGVSVLFSTNVRSLRHTESAWSVGLALATLFGIFAYYSLLARIRARVGAPVDAKILGEICRWATPTAVLVAIVLRAAAVAGLGFVSAGGLAWFLAAFLFVSASFYYHVRLLRFLIS